MQIPSTNINTTSSVLSGSLLASGGTSNTIYSNSNSTITIGTSNIQFSSGSSYMLPTKDHFEFMELVLAALGYDVTYESFIAMNESERKGILREIKLNRIL